MSSSTGVFSLFCRLGVVYLIFRVLPREGRKNTMLIKKTKTCTQILQFFVGKYCFLQRITYGTLKIFYLVLERYFDFPDTMMKEIAQHQCNYC